MSETKTRKVHSASFKAKVALEAVRETKTLNEVGQEYGIHPVQVSHWKKTLVDKASEVFEGKRGPQAVTEHGDPERLYSEIGRLKMELDWLKKKVRAEPVAVRRPWISPEDPLPLVRQCAVAGVGRATYYAHQHATRVDEDDAMLRRLIDEEYTRPPFFGSRRMVWFLRERGFAVNRKRVRRLMQQLGLAGMVPGPHTSQPHPAHWGYPYLRRGLAIQRPNQAWSTDITYIRLAHGFGYLVAIMDWYSRKVLAWRLSTTLDAGFCVDCFQEAVRRFGVPEIFNTDQGAQFTSHDFINALKAHPLRISMDGRGRAADHIFVERLWRTVEYEDIYLQDYETLSAAPIGLKVYFPFYNGARGHQSLGYQTPDVVYATGQGGGAKIIDKFGRPAEPASAPRPTDESAPQGAAQQVFCCT